MVTDISSGTLRGLIAILARNFVNYVTVSREIPADKRDKQAQSLSRAWPSISLAVRRMLPDVSDENEEQLQERFQRNILAEIEQDLWDKNMLRTIKARDFLATVCCVGVGGAVLMMSVVRASWPGIAFAVAVLAVRDIHYRARFRKPGSALTAPFPVFAVGVLAWILSNPRFFHPLPRFYVDHPDFVRVVHDAMPTGLLGALLAWVLCCFVSTLDYRRARYQLLADHETLVMYRLIHVIAVVSRGGWMPQHLRIRAEIAYELDMAANSLDLLARDSSADWMGTRSSAAVRSVFYGLARSMEEFKMALALPEREGLGKLVEGLSEIVAALLTGHLGYVALPDREARKNSLEANRRRYFNNFRSFIVSMVPAVLIVATRWIQPPPDPQIMTWVTVGAVAWGVVWISSALTGKPPQELLAVISQFVVTARTVVAGAGSSDKENQT